MTDATSEWRTDRDELERDMRFLDRRGERRRGEEAVLGR